MRRINFESIHGTDRTYAVITKNGRVKQLTFEVSGYGVTQKDKQKEARFRRRLELWGIKYIFVDVSF